MTGGVDSLLGASDIKRTLRGLFGETGDETEDIVDDWVGRCSFRGIFFIVVSSGVLDGREEGLGVNFCFFVLGSPSAVGDAETS